MFAKYLVKIIISLATVILKKANCFFSFKWLVFGCVPQFSNPCNQSQQLHNKTKTDLHS